MLLALGSWNPVAAYERYNDGCMECHGAFTDDTSPKGSVFPSGSKHEMHRAAASMDTACNLCHTNGDQRNPFIGSSEGTAVNRGLGCTGCHVATGLRAHHAVNNVVDGNGETCADCHGLEPEPPAENVIPPYYGTADTRVANPCNDVMAEDTNENWTLGDFVGLDNDGDNLYDLADFDCGPPYRIVAVEIEGDNVRITWETVGGRRDILQSSPDLETPFSDVGPATDIEGVGVVTTNTVDLNGATGPSRFYRIRYAGAPP